MFSISLGTYSAKIVSNYKYRESILNCVSICAISNVNAQSSVTSDSSVVNSQVQDLSCLVI